MMAQQAEPAAVSTLLFTVNNREVSTEEFKYLYLKNYPKKEDHTEVKINNYLDLLIAFKTKVAEAINRGYDTTAAFRKEFRSYRGELMRPYVADKNQLDRLTREAYERMGIEVRVSHILFVLKPDATPGDTLAAYNKALAVRERLMRGDDFAKLAREFSEEPGAKTNNGDLGYFTVMQMVYPFEQAAYSLKTGEISPIVKTSFGYHLLKVTDRRLARGEVEVSHILLRKSPTTDEKKLRNKIFDIYDQLQGGRPWDDLCREFSDDQSTRNSGGRLKPFGVGAFAASVPEFEATAFSIHQPGEVSDPFQSVYGWHIVRLERRIPIPPFQQIEETLRRRVGNDERLLMAEQHVFEKRKVTLQFVEQESIKKIVFALGDSTLQAGKWKFKGPSDLWSKQLFTLRGTGFTVSQFVSFVLTEQFKTNQPPATLMERFYGQFVRQQMDDVEDADLTKSNQTYRNLIKEYREGILLFTIMEKEVWNKGSEDTAGVRAYYTKHRDRYRAAERVKARIFSTDDSLFMNQIKSKVAKGDSLTRLDMKKFRSAQVARVYASGESKVIDRIPKVVGVHFTSQTGMYHMVQIDNLVPAGIRDLEEVRSQVISDYQDTLEKEWVAKLKKKYPAKVNSKGKKIVLRELTQP